MNKEDAQEIIDCLPKGRTVFYYFKDRYAPLLLSLANEDTLSISALKKSPLARLLDKAIIKNLIAQCGDGTLSKALLDNAWTLDYECYVLSLGLWNGQNQYWGQTTRRGWNLVLQLNFSQQHDEQYRKLVDPKGEYMFEYTDHPIATGKRHTLAWCRIDIDESWSFALIEEVQNDWLRRASWVAGRIRKDQETVYWRGIPFSAQNLKHYVQDTLRIHNQIWAEALLSAAIWFLRNEIGIRKIFYHTHRTGAALKKIGRVKPPRSLYTTLPRQFCFRKTREVPDFVKLSSRCPASRKLKRDATFNLLEL